MSVLSELFPLPRSLTGNGVRRTLDVLGKRIPLEVTEIPSGTAIVYSTYLGGAGFDEAFFGLAVDAAGQAYITGLTASADFPIVNAVQPTRNGRATCNRRTRRPPSTSRPSSTSDSA